MHPDWVLSVRDQCAAAGADFFFKGWGRWVNPENAPYDFHPTKVFNMHPDGSEAYFHDGKSGWSIGSMYYIATDAGCLLDGREYKSLPWVKGA